MPQIIISFDSEHVLILTRHTSQLTVNPAAKD